ncbi:unnamed protein product [Hermetia illucens]|uniref:Acid phosphatase n=2 Tax=Hermetia illucens TaxID=343691 RepID=A0A7R8UKV7_HERIL|nr:unnamed protein product [Hermetia illucens]
MTIVERTNLDNQEIMDFMGPKFYLFSYISEHMGMRITLLHDIVRLVDTLQQESKVGLQIPSWALDLYNDTLIPLDLLSHHLTYQTKLSYVRAGSLLNEIMKYLDNFSKPSTNKRRISIMSGHDLTVGSIAYLLGFNSQIPLLVDFACTLAIELYESPQLGDDYEIKFLFFRNHADDNPIQIRIPECSSPCSIKTFRKIAESKVVDDYDRVCNNYHENDVHFVNL